MQGNLVYASIAGRVEKIESGVMKDNRVYTAVHVFQNEEGERCEPIVSKIVFYDKMIEKAKQLKVGTSAVIKARISGELFNNKEYVRAVAI